MHDSGWTRLFIADGHIRSLWRIVLFALLFVAFAVLGTLLLTSMRPPMLAGGLVWQGAITLAAALAAGWLLLRGLDGRPPGALGFAFTSATVREILGGLAVGAGILTAVTGVLVLSGMIGFEPDRGGIGDFAAVLGSDFVVLGIAAAAEEALFRGYPFQVLVQGTGPVVATVLSSALFAVAHAPNPNVGALALANIFLAGILLSVAYLRTRSLWFATAVHLGWNWMMASVFDLPVSGLEFFDTPMYTAVPTGPEWLTGGAFGPEGGLAGTVGFVLGMALVLRVRVFRETSEMRALKPLVDGRM